MKHKKIFLTIAFISLAFIFAFILRDAFFKVISLIISASVQAYLLLPLIKPLEKRTPKPFAIILGFVITLVINASVIILLIPLFAGQFKTFVELLPQYIDSARTFINDKASNIPLINSIFDKFDLNTTLLQKITDGFSEFSPSVILSFAASSLLTPVLMFYILLGRDDLKTVSLFFIPQRIRTQTLLTFREINRQLRDYVTGQFIIVTIVSFIMALALAVFRFDYWLILGIIMGIFNIIPYIGPILGSIPIIFVAATQGFNRIWLALILIVAVQQIDNLFVHPYVISSSLQIHPAVVLLCVTAGSSIGSLPGMVLAIPIFIILRILVKEFYRFFTERKRKFPKLSKI